MRRISGLHGCVKYAMVAQMPDIRISLDNQTHARLKHHAVDLGVPVSNAAAAVIGAFLDYPPKAKKASPVVPSGGSQKRKSAAK
jgi:hypothetical protein